MSWGTMCCGLDRGMSGCAAMLAALRPSASPMLSSYPALVTGSLCFVNRIRDAITVDLLMRVAC